MVVQVYIPQNKISTLELDKIFHFKTKVIIMGDLNSRRVERNCFSVNYNGNILIEYCLNKHVTTAAPDMPTHYPKRVRPSVIDFFLIKNL